ncbi:MAG TPA: HAD family phosphatase, partial [Rubrivivax sp.]|nr:HAD family phosphatase [Rubrivivax sp.]
MSKALILDFGGVISRTLFETHALSEHALGLPPGTLRWRGPFDPSTDAPWCDMQAGRISERDYWQARSAEVGRLVGEDWTRMQDFVQRARGADPASVIRPEAVAAIEAAGFKPGRDL